MNEDDDIEKHPATMMFAPIKYSVINKYMFDEGRICDSNIEEIDDVEITVPLRGSPGSFSQITVSSRAKLTWKRSKSNASHKTMFYVVHQEFLDIDLLLGSLDSGEGMSLVPTPEQIRNGHTLHILTDQICQKQHHHLPQKEKVTMLWTRQSLTIALLTPALTPTSPLVYSPTSSSKVS